MLGTSTKRVSTTTMSTVLRGVAAAATALLAVPSMQVAAAGSSSTSGASSSPNYMWVDTNGERHYGDSVPPENAQGERRVLNSVGVEVQRVDAQKSAAQLAEQSRGGLEAQQRQQHDRFLLTLYTSTKDIERLRDERLDQIEGQIRAAIAYIDSLEARLKTLQERAMHFKPNSTKPDARRMPDDLAEELVRLASEGRTQRAALETRRKEQSDLRAQFEADISRYRELTAQAGS